MANHIKHKEVDLITGPEARGFIVGAPLCIRVRCRVTDKKEGQVAGKTVKADKLEYGSDIIEMHEDAVKPGQKVVVVDDLLATGGTIFSTIELVEKLGGEISAVVFLIELMDLNGRQHLTKYDVFSLIKY